MIFSYDVLKFIRIQLLLSCLKVRSFEFLVGLGICRLTKLGYRGSRKDTAFSRVRMVCALENSYKLQSISLASSNEQQET